MTTPDIALARRFWMHVHEGGTLTSLDVGRMVTALEGLEAKLAQQDDLVRAAVAAALTEAAGVARLVRDTGDKAHALGIEENAAAYASAGEVIETRILDLITPDAQAALDRVVAAERGRIADLERRLKLWVPQNISETGRWPIPKGEE